MDIKEKIAGHSILIVDDEEDVLNVLVDLLDSCKVDTAKSFEAAKNMLENNYYDVAILDIMGVRGFDLLEIAKKKNIPALMLTAHGLSEENLKKSAQNGAYYYAPKDEINNIETFLADVIEAQEKQKNPWVKWFERLGGFYDRKFGGPDWREKERDFWNRKVGRLPHI